MRPVMMPTRRDWPAFHPLLRYGFSPPYAEAPEDCGRTHRWAHRSPHKPVAILWHSILSLSTPGRGNEGLVGGPDCSTIRKSILTCSSASPRSSSSLRAIELKQCVD